MKINLDLSMSELFSLRAALNSHCIMLWEKKSIIKKAINGSNMTMAMRCALHEELKETNARLESLQQAERKVDHAVCNQTGEDV